MHSAQEKTDLLCLLVCQSSPFKSCQKQFLPIPTHQKCSLLLLMILVGYSFHSYKPNLLVKSLSNFFIRIHNKYSISIVVITNEYWYLSNLAMPSFFKQLPTHYWPFQIVLGRTWFSSVLGGSVGSRFGFWGQTRGSVGSRFGFDGKTFKKSPIFCHPI